MKYTGLLFLICFFLNQEGYCQEDAHIFPGEAYCYELYPQEPIKAFNSKSSYTGRVIVSVEVDTIQTRLVNYQILFAKLKSTSNPKDSIQVRLEKSWGNYQVLTEMMPAILEHLHYIQVRRVKTGNCITPKFSLPLKIE